MFYIDVLRSRQPEKPKPLLKASAWKGPPPILPRSGAFRILSRVPPFRCGGPAIAARRYPCRCFGPALLAPRLRGEALHLSPREAVRGAVAVNKRELITEIGRRPHEANA